jgi:predicted alpha/beta hydrolase
VKRAAVSSAAPQSRRRAKRAKQDWAPRSKVATPRCSFEELEIHTSDGASLRVLVDDPPDGIPQRGTLVLAHGTLRRKDSFGTRDRPGLSSALSAIGLRTIAFDFRAHGASVPPAGRPWGYDDLVRNDLPAVVEYARATSSERAHPVVVLGHGLGGHVALAAQGTSRIEADAIVTLGANVWLRETETSLVRWGAKRAIAFAALAISARAGGIPARTLRLGSEDAGAAWVRERLLTVTRGRWTSADEHDDYLASLARVTVPVAAVVGDRDLLFCPARVGEAFARRCGGPVELLHARGGHVDLVAGARARVAVVRAVEWAFAQARP